MRIAAAMGLLTALVLSACTVGGPAPASSSPGPGQGSAPASAPGTPAGSTSGSATRSSTTTTRPAPPTTAPSTPVAPSSPVAPSDPVDPPDPRWRFYGTDPVRYASTWFAGRHRTMVPFGCTAAPYYAHDSRCPGTQGFHHGIDVAMPCGTPLYAQVAGQIVAPGARGSLGTAYGPHAFRIRDATEGVDIVLGHVHTVYVQPGDPVTVGQRIALSSDEGAPDGCHLHFEVRPSGGGVSTAIDPRPYLHLTR